AHARLRLWGGLLHGAPSLAGLYAGSLWGAGRAPAPERRTAVGVWSRRGGVFRDDAERVDRRPEHRSAPVRGRTLTAAAIAPRAGAPPSDPVVARGVTICYLY